MSDCVIWKGKTRSNGRYGYLSFNGKTVSAHRYVCQIHHGPPPSSKSFACHKCHNSLCVNAEHIYWGDAMTNYLDSKDKMNAALFKNHSCQKGHKNRRCKLTEEEYKQRYESIVSLRSKGLSYRQIAKILNFKSPGNVFNVLRSGI